jgi:Lipase (class 3)
MVSSVQPDIEATLDERMLYQLSVYANLLTGGTGATGADLEAKLREKIGDQLAANAAGIGHWEIVWGPAIRRFDTSLFAVNGMYLVRDLDAPRRHVLVVSGMSSPTPFDWLAEDVLVQAQVPWPGVADARISLAAAIGLNVLQRVAPSGDRAGAGQPVRRFLRSLTDTNIELIVVGHGLGGMLAPTLALWLRDTQAQWNPAGNATVATVATGGPTAGNSVFAAHSDRRLSATTRFANALDVVPCAWNIGTLEDAKRLYTSHMTNPAGPLFGCAQRKVTSGDYLHVDPKPREIASEMNEEIIDEAASPWRNFVAQVTYQHEKAYAEYFDIPGVNTPEIIAPDAAAGLVFGPILQAAAARTGAPIPAELTMVSPRAADLTVPVSGKVARLPDDPRSAEMRSLVGTLTSSLRAEAPTR